MKKLLVLVMVGIVAMFTFVGCGKDLNYEPDEATVVDIEVESNEFKPDEKWVKYTYWNSDASEAHRQCKEGYYFHLDRGETVSEIIETSDNLGNPLFYYKVKVAG